MDEHDWLAQRFEAHRAHLQAVAFRLLGSTTEADDAVQDAWLRVSRAGASGVENVGGWLTTVVSRVCLNMLESRRSRREESLDAHAPEPVVRGTGGPDPEQEALLADAVGPALLVVLDTLEPAERLANCRAATDDRRAVVGRGAAISEPRSTPRAGHGVGAPGRSRAPARHRGCVPGRRPQRRFRRIAGIARSRRRAPRRPCRRGSAPRVVVPNDHWRDGRSKDLLRTGAGRANRIGGRNGWSRMGFGRQASRRLRLYDRLREDCRDRLARRPRSAPAARRGDSRRSACWLSLPRLWRRPCRSSVPRVMHERISCAALKPVPPPRAPPATSGGYRP